MAKGFIDLGLPSGNLWATENEVAENGQPLYATYDEAVKQYGENLPTQDDWQELLDNVPHLWDKKRMGLLFVARNGKELFLPASGYRDLSSVYDVQNYGYYWSATASGSYYACRLYFYSLGADAYSSRNRYYEQAVRLIKKGGKQ